MYTVATELVVPHHTQKLFGLHKFVCSVNIVVKCINYFPLVMLTQALSPTFSTKCSSWRRSGQALWLVATEWPTSCSITTRSYQNISVVTTSAPGTTQLRWEPLSTESSLETTSQSSSSFRKSAWYSYFSKQKKSKSKPFSRSGVGTGGAWPPQQWVVSWISFTVTSFILWRMSSGPTFSTEVAPPQPFNCSYSSNQVFKH